MKEQFTQGPLNIDQPFLPFLSKRVITDLSRTAPYLIRWSLWLPWGWSLKLHQILRADDDRCVHDHPWVFLRIILWGGYEEIHATHDGEERVSIRKPWRPWAPWRVYRCPAGFRHRITRLLGKSSWSLVVAGPRFREWGFYTLRGWMAWRQFVDAAWGQRVLWCDDGRDVAVGNGLPTAREMDEAYHTGDGA